MEKINNMVLQIETTLKNSLKNIGIDINNIGSKAELMILKFEIGKYFLNKSNGKKYNILEKSKYVCENIYNTTKSALEITMEKVFKNTDTKPTQLEKIYMINTTLTLIGEKLFKENYLGKDNE